MYLEVLVTVITVILLLWLLYDSILARIIHKPGKAISKFSGHSPDFYDVFGQIRAEFQKGHFEQVITLTDSLLANRPFESSALSYKAYALFHLKKYTEAKEIFLLLETLPEQDNTKMLAKIDERLSP